MLVQASRLNQNLSLEDQLIFKKNILIIQAGRLDEQ